jgi:hypothetical protein
MVEIKARDYSGRGLRTRRSWSKPGELGTGSGGSTPGGVLRTNSGWEYSSRRTEEQE